MNKPEELSIDYTIHFDEDYSYRVHIGENMSVSYSEPNANIHVEVTFGSLEEMESVAKTMLLAVKSASELAEHW